MTKVLCIANQGTNALKEYAIFIAQAIHGDDKIDYVYGMVYGLVTINNLRPNYINSFKKYIKLRSKNRSNDNVEKGLSDGCSTGGYLKRIVKKVFYKIYWRIVVSIFTESDYFKDLDVVIMMDETYGALLLADEVLTNNKTLITNISGEDFSFTMTKGSDNRANYFYKNNWTPIPRSCSKFVTEVNELMSKYISAKTDHRDYSLAYSSNKALFKPFENSKIKLLIASHIFKDASAQQDMAFANFEDWIDALVAYANSNRNIDLYIKEHPAAPVYDEVGYLSTLVKNRPVTIIKHDKKINLSDFDLVISNNGSIIYEAVYNGIPCISTAPGFSQNFHGVVTIKSPLQISDCLRNLNPEYIEQLRCEIKNNAIDNLNVIYEWHVLRKLANSTYFDRAGNIINFDQFKTALNSIFAEFMDRSDFINAKILCDENKSGIKLRPLLFK